MDSSLPVVSDDGDPSWSDTHSMDSDDGNSMMWATTSPPWMEAGLATSAAALPVSSTMSISHTGQLSPISTGMDLPAASADNTCHSALSHGSAPAMMHSESSSSFAGSWTQEFEDSDDMAALADESGDNNDPYWEQESDDVLRIPKLEPLDDDGIRLQDLQDAPLTPVPSNSEPTPAQPKVKRPRGRPRKHPHVPVVVTNKVTKGRSKTGCLTCRKRKKKCDEAKPRCMNCEKNAVVCEGYPEKQIWKSGREKAEEERLKSQNLPITTIQPIFYGLETIEDRVFWKHYNEQLSAVLTVEGEQKNAFRDMIVPIAVHHEGLMHSILALAGKHIDYDTPYGMKILNNSNTTLEALQQRAEFHRDLAMAKILEDLGKQDDKSDPDYKTLLCARYGQILCLLLESLAEGSPHGNHRVHLRAYQNLIRDSPPEDPAFLSFITEFFQYHIFADDLIRHPSNTSPRLASEDWKPTAPIHPPRLLGVADGLFNFLAQVTSIRKKMVDQNEIVLEYDSLFLLSEIYLDIIHHWNPEWPRGDSRGRVSLLYKHMMLLYILQTCKPPAPALSSGSTSLLSSATLHQPVPPLSSSAANTPPRSTSSSCASSPRMPHAQAPTHHIDPHHLTSLFADLETHLQHHQQGSRGDSPPPSRLPAYQDPRIATYVDESLTLLESFKPSDPAQTLLLIPCLVVGTGCFAQEQQARLRTAVRVVRGYTGFRNTDCVIEVLEEVWRLMAQGDWVAVWDWQGVARGLGLDFLCS